VVQGERGVRVHKGNPPCPRTFSGQRLGNDPAARDKILQRDGTREHITCLRPTGGRTGQPPSWVFTKTVGLRGIETNGEYENAACTDTTGDHRNGVDGSYHAPVRAPPTSTSASRAGAWASADASSGAVSTATPTATRTRGPPDLLGAHRRGARLVYDSTVMRVASSGGYGVADVTNDAMDLSRPRAGWCASTTRSPPSSRRK
jgi:hypothetical protein